jgi:hypothetical protein
VFLEEVWFRRCPLMSESKRSNRKCQQLLSELAEDGCWKNSTCPPWNYYINVTILNYIRALSGRGWRARGQGESVFLDGSASHLHWTILALKSQSFSFSGYREHGMKDLRLALVPVAKTRATPPRRNCLRCIGYWATSRPTNVPI